LDGFFGPRSLAALGLYVEERFELHSSSEGELPLEFVGAELRAQDVLIYQEARHPPPPRRLKVRNAILTDIEPRQINQVNLILAQEIKTLMFDAAHVSGRF